MNLKQASISRNERLLPVISNLDGIKVIFEHQPFGDGFLAKTKTILHVRFSSIKDIKMQTFFSRVQPSLFDCLMHIYSTTSHIYTLHSPSIQPVSQPISSFHLDLPYLLPRTGLFCSASSLSTWLELPCPSVGSGLVCRADHAFSPKSFIHGLGPIPSEILVWPPLPVTNQSIGFYKNPFYLFYNPWAPAKPHQIRSIHCHNLVSDQEAYLVHHPDFPMST